MHGLDLGWALLVGAAAPQIQEKSNGRIADTTHACGERVKVVCIAGLPSSGKMTSNKRLCVQVNGMTRSVRPSTTTT